MNASPAERGLSPGEYQRFTDLVRAASGLEIPASRRTVLEHAVRASMAELQVSRPDELLDRLQDGTDHRRTVEALVARLTIGETHFFRNRPQFEALRNVVLPQIIDKRREVRRLRLWSAGCATGEEPYSLAIMLEGLLPDIADWSIHILATDVNRDSLARARVGAYGARAFREVPEGIRDEAFTQTGSSFAILPRIRRMVSFAYLNLVLDDYPSLTSTTNAMDLILCRNVLIYFNEATVRGVVGRLRASLDSGGWLVVGAAESSQTFFQGFCVHNAPGAVLFQNAPVDAPTPLPSPRPPIPPHRASTPPASAPSTPQVPRPAPVAPVRSLTQLPDPPPGEVRSVLELIRRAQRETALTELLTLATTRPHEVWVPYLLAQVHADRGDLEDAETWIDRALVLAPLLAPAHHLRGLILQELGRFDEGLEALRRCTYADPEFWLGYFSMAGLLDQMAQPRAAAKTLSTLANLLASRDRHDLVPQADTMTVGRLSEVVSAHRELLRQ